MFPIQNGVPHRSAPFVTWSLIATNVAVFLPLFAFLFVLRDRGLDSACVF